MTALRAFIIHGYLGYPEEAWLPWLKRELEGRGYQVSLPSMPNADRPTIPGWTSFIRGLVGAPDRKTVMIGHSLGGNAVLRYLETLDDAGEPVLKTVLVASGFPSGLPPDQAEGGPEVDEALRPWFRTGVDPRKVKRAAGQCTVILSDDDPYISFEAAKAGFQAHLDARIIVEHGKGHLNEDSGISELPSALAAVLS